MSDARMQSLERAARLGSADPDALAAARARWRLCCRGTGWSAPWERCGCGLPPSAAEWESWLPPAVERVDDMRPQSELDAQRERWLRIGLATGPSDRELARAGIEAAYQSAGLGPPQLVWLDSPMRGAIGAAMLAQVGDQVKDQVWTQVWAQVRDQVGDQVRRACYGSHDAHWLGHYETWLRSGLRAPARLRGLMWTAQACGWWWPFERVAIVTERPSVIEWRDDGRMKRVVYPDGWEVQL